MPEPFVKLEIDTALRACTAALHELVPADRLVVMELLGRWYLPDGSYHDRIDPKMLDSQPSGEMPMR